MIDYSITYTNINTNIFLRPIGITQIVVMRRMVEYGMEAMPQCVILLIALQYSFEQNSISNINNTTSSLNTTNTSISSSQTELISSDASFLTVIIVQLVSLAISTLSISFGISTASTSIDSNIELREVHPWTYGYVPSRRYLFKHILTKLSLTTYVSIFLFLFSLR